MDIKPIAHELVCVYITGDGKRHYTKEKAKRHQRRLIAKQKS